MPEPTSPPKQDKTTRKVYRLRSDFELPLDEVYDFLDDYEAPEPVDSIDVTRRGSKLMLTAVADRDDSDYTPTALLKASLKERRLYDTEEGWSREPPEPDGIGHDEDETETKTVEYACFKGDRETVLQNTALQYPMLLVLVDIALFADTGELTAVTASDEEISATRVVEGEQRPATVEVVDPVEESGTDNTSNWRDNSLIG